MGLTVVSKMLGYSPSGLLKMARRGVIPQPIVIGSVRRWYLHEIEALLARLEIERQAQAVAIATRNAEFLERLKAERAARNAAAGIQST